MSTTVQIGTGSGGAGTSTITILINELGGVTSGTVTKTPNPMQNANSPMDMQTINLSSGANTITVPALAGGVIIQPPSNNTQSLTLKGVSGDTGIRMNNAGINMISFHSSPVSNFVITAGGSVTGVLFFWF